MRKKPLKLIICTFYIKGILLSFAVIVLAYTSEANSDDIRDHPHCRNGTGITIFPNRYSCNDYYVCVWKNAIKESCPLDYEFNPNTLQCDLKENAGCSVIKNYYRCIGREGTLIKKYNDCYMYYHCDEIRTARLFDCPPDLEFNEEAQMCLERSVAKCARIPNYPGCENTGHKLLPVPNDCTSYYECINSMAYRYPCYDGNYFDAEKEKCDFEENVTC